MLLDRDRKPHEHAEGSLVCCLQFSRRGSRNANLQRPNRAHGCDLRCACVLANDFSEIQNLREKDVKSGKTKSLSSSGYRHLIRKLGLKTIMRQLLKVPRRAICINVSIEFDYQILYYCKNLAHRPPETGRRVHGCFQT